MREGCLETKNVSIFRDLESDQYLTIVLFSTIVIQGAYLCKCSFVNIDIIINKITRMIVTFSLNSLLSLQYIKQYSISTQSFNEISFDPG